MCGSRIESVCSALCQCCVEDAVCSSGLGTRCIHPLFCVFVCVNITLRDVLSLKHSSDDSPRKRGLCVPLCQSVCLFTHLMDYTVKEVGELANSKVVGHNKNETMMYTH